VCVHLLVSLNVASGIPPINDSDFGAFGASAFFASPALGLLLFGASATPAAFLALMPSAYTFSSAAALTALASSFGFSCATFQAPSLTISCFVSYSCVFPLLSFNVTGSGP